jgi:hypothetical protein
MKTSLRLASIVVLLIGAHLTIPKIVETAAALNTVSPNRLELSVQNIEDNIASEARILKSNTYKVVADKSSYEPPNYGGPDSQYGSGTR